jgi:hypothetical protein
MAHNALRRIVRAVMGCAIFAWATMLPSRKIEVPADWRLVERSAQSGLSLYAVRFGFSNLRYSSADYLSGLSNRVVVEIESVRKDGDWLVSSIGVRLIRNSDDSFLPIKGIGSGKQ